MDLEPQTLPQLFFHHVDRYRLEPMLQWQGKDSVPELLSTAQFARSVYALRDGLCEAGLQPGDRVAICSENRPGWHIADFACQLARLVSVPLYPTLPAQQLRSLLEHSGARAVISGGEQHTTISALVPSLPGVVSHLSMDRDLPRLAERVYPPQAVAAIRAFALEARPRDLATIVYTSGTTGQPKGVMLSHGNLMFDLARSVRRLPGRSVRGALSILPLSHVFERILCNGYILRGAPIAYGDPHDLRNLLRRYRPEIVGVVPRVLEKIREAVDTQIAALPAWKQSLSRFFTECGLEHARRSGHWKGRLQPLAAALVFRKIRRQLGGLQHVIVGGAWLDPGLEEFFRACGFTVLQGYGLTETSPVITFNAFGREKTGAVGPALDGVELRISEDGEILTRGPHVMKGYFRNPEATAAAFRDGWFLTGDLGSLDDEGHLRITGRRKEMLLLSNGKNIYYAPLEQALRSSPLIEQAFVVGEGRSYTCALLVPNAAALLRLAAERGILNHSLDSLLLTEPVLAAYRAELERCQMEFSRFEQVKRFCFLSEAILLDAELVTPTQKVRRNVLERKYAECIARLYGMDAPFYVPAPPEPARTTEFGRIPSK